MILTKRSFRDVDRDVLSSSVDGGSVRRRRPSGTASDYSTAWTLIFLKTFDQAAVFISAVHADLNAALHMQPALQPIVGIHTTPFLLEFVRNYLELVLRLKVTELR
jgi:hypothetical protein